MKKVTEANFKPNSIKILESGVVVQFDGTVNLGNDVNSTTKGKLENKDAPHIDFRKAMDLLLPVVVYDEGTGDVEDFKKFGLDLF